MADDAGSPKDTRLLKVGIAVAFLAMAVGVVVWTLRGQTPRIETPTQAWYYDLSAKKLFASDINEYPPITAPSGGEGVRARVFSCGKCGSPDEADRWIGYLERVPPEIAKAIADVKSGAVKPASPMQGMQGLMRQASEDAEVAAVDTPEDWVRKSSPSAPAIMDAHRAKCEGSAAEECFPRKK